MVWALQFIDAQKLAPYPTAIFSLALFMLLISFLLYTWPEFATGSSIVGIVGASIFILSTVYKSLFTPPDSPFLSMWFISASHAYELILLILTFAIFQRGAVFLSCIMHALVCGMVGVHCFMAFERLQPATITPMVTLTIGPIISIFGLTFVVRWRNEATLRAFAMQHEKEKLMAMLSHEIRGQLQTTLSTGELLNARVVDPVAKRALFRLTRVTLQLDRYLRDWMEFIRLENPDLGIEEKRFNLVELIDQVLEEHQQTFLDKGLALSGPLWSTLDTSAMLRWQSAQGDPLRLKQVLSNLLDNALKYTMKGSVRVGVSTPIDQAHWARVFVTDTGLGIPQDQLQLVFQPFMRLNTKGSAPIEGSGLGLAIASRLMQRMGGQLEVSSRPGEGASFTMSFPLKPRAGQKR
jgi:signal transduction histidine kinase